MNVRQVKIVAAIGVVLVLCSAGWQIGKCELANVELREDMHDMASQLGPRIGYGNGLSDEEFRNQVVRKAREYDIQLAPEQVTVVRNGEGFQATMYLAADYTVPLNLPGFSFQLHFKPESGRKPD